MSSTPSPAAAPTAAEARPVDASERVTLIDVLRGAALCGIFVSNAYSHLSGRALLPQARIEALTSSTVDVVANHLYELFIAEKAMTTFSFLFGLGFAIQMGRAEHRGASVVPVYARRLGVLLLIGLTHLFAIWYGDILTLYASLGFVLLLFRSVPDKRLLAWSLSLIFGGPLVITAMTKYVPLLASSPEVAQAAMKEALAQANEIRGQTLAAFASGEYLRVVRANAYFYVHVFLRPLMVSYSMMVLGRFLLGLIAGRRRLFHDMGQHLPFFRRLLRWGLAVGLVGNGLAQLISKESSWLVIRPSLWELATLGTASFYIAGITLLFQRPRWRRWLSVFAPPGQMALTNYLSQTVLGQLVFYGYGLGLIGQLRSAVCLVAITGLYGVQILVSHLWLARFRFGPVEWLWRSLTYGKLQPMRRAPTRAGEGVSPA